MQKDPHAGLKGPFPSLDEIPPDFRLNLPVSRPVYLVDGKVLSWEGPLAEVSSPICLRKEETVERTLVGYVPAMDESIALEALESANRAWNSGRGEWPTMSIWERIEVAEAFVARMQPLRQETVKLLMWEVGKSLEESCKEFDRTTDYIIRTLDVLKSRKNSRFAMEEGTMARVRSTPLGVCLVMGPFNNPLYETYAMLIPALVMGNTTLVKAPRFGALLHQPFLKALGDSFPAGSVNFIYGNENGSDNIGSVMKRGSVNALAFTGSNQGADYLIRQHPSPYGLHCVLALGAKNPALIMADADLDVAVRECVSGTLSFNGQRCTALKIVFVHESIAEVFLEKLCRAIDQLPIGMPWQEGVKITPLPEIDKTGSMKAYVDDAVARGAKLVNRRGGQTWETIYSPTVVYPVSPESLLYREEQFGPVVPVCSYRDEGEFLDFVAASKYGQQVSLFGNNPAKILGLIDNLANQVGRINVNCQCRRSPDGMPFTGRKASARGVLSFSDTLDSFSTPSLVALPSDQESFGMIRTMVSTQESDSRDTHEPEEVLLSLGRAPR
jgi:glyceraldehyde-3-phosphate dehydrogenase (NADP+)